MSCRVKCKQVCVNDNKMTVLPLFCSDWWSYPADCAGCVRYRCICGVDATKGKDRSDCVALWSFGRRRATNHIPSPTHPETVLSTGVTIIFSVFGKKYIIISQNSLAMILSKLQIWLFGGRKKKSEVPLSCVPQVLRPGSRYEVSVSGVRKGNESGSISTQFTTGEVWQQADVVILLCDLMPASGNKTAMTYGRMHAAVFICTGSLCEQLFKVTVTVFKFI